MRAISKTTIAGARPIVLPLDEYSWRGLDAT
jgi:hypothetical protein